MDDKTSKNVGEPEVRGKSSSSESSEYELVENENNNQEASNLPVLCETKDVSEDLINDAIGSSALNSPTTAANNMMVGKSIFYDCNDRTNSSDTDDEGKTPYFFFVIEAITLNTY